MVWPNNVDCRDQWDKVAGPCGGKTFLPVRLVTLGAMAMPRQELCRISFRRWYITSVKKERNPTADVAIGFRPSAGDSGLIVVADGRHHRRRLPVIPYHQCHPLGEADVPQQQPDIRPAYGILSFLPPPSSDFHQFNVVQGKDQSVTNADIPSLNRTNRREWRLLGGDHIWMMFASTVFAAVCLWPWAIPVLCGGGLFLTIVKTVLVYAPHSVLVVNLTPEYTKF